MFGNTATRNLDNTFMETFNLWRRNSLPHAVVIKKNDTKLPLQINSKNKALERKSQMLIQKMSVGPSLVEINIDDNEEENSHENEYIQKLNRQIQGL